MMSAATTGLFVGLNSPTPAGYTAVAGGLNPGSISYDARISLYYTTIEAVGKAVSGITMIVGSATEPPPGYTKLDCDLNASFYKHEKLYLCYTTSTAIPGHLTDFKIISGDNQGIHPGDGWVRFPMDCNHGKDEPDDPHVYVYICYKSHI